VLEVGDADNAGKVFVRLLNTTEERWTTADHVHYPGCQRQLASGGEECPFLSNDYHLLKWASAETLDDEMMGEARYVGCVV
jgi:hypothetical protein